MIVSASLHSCFAENQDDSTFTVAMKFKMAPSNSGRIYDVIKSCSYTMTSREATGAPDLKIWKIILHTPEEKTVEKETLQRMGYGIQSSPKRLFMRIPYNMPETNIQRVEDVDMVVFKSVVLLRDRWMMSVVDSIAACPISGASLVGDKIFWKVPLHITPLSSKVEILELHMGVNGRRLTPGEIENRNYTMSLTESHVVFVIPIGAPDGFYKSHSLQGQYHVSYSIEPLFELLWQDELHKTRYRVSFPITTPLTPAPPQIIDNTEPKEKTFDVSLGFFLPDVELLNITIGTELFTVPELAVRDIGLLERVQSNATKVFVLQIPFSEPNVRVQKDRPDVTSYSLPLVFGFIIFPELESFSYSTLLEASVTDPVLPNAGGSCGLDSFNVFVKYGSAPRSALKVKLSQTELNEEDSPHFEHHSNGTHLNIVVPFLSPLVALEAVQLTGVVGRVNLEIYDSLHDWRFKDFTLSCIFFAQLTECFSNGTAVVLLPKLESVQHLPFSELSLRDPACKPLYSQGNMAYFRFDVNTCGTTRKFVEDTITYENEVTWEGEPVSDGASNLYPGPQYRFLVSCVYVANATQSLRFQTLSNKKPQTDIAKGELSVSLKLSQDMVYRLFYHDGDFPVLKVLKQPLFFEVSMDQSTDSTISVVLKNCWATLTKDKESEPRWDLIIDGCPNPEKPDQTVFHPVMEDERVDIPDHFKRFEVKTSTFAKDHGRLDNDAASINKRVFFHCDVIFCHAEDATDGHCKNLCKNPQRRKQRSLNRGRRSSKNPLHHLSIGPILLI
ncbi:hypothetical protein DNTS_016119 [Danionella cerebrum]|uniref:ZP domain-containing protein n=1 Tax=Danionella cerebrum TaxID=2873325 RepID=A0A553Q8N8_9TELE|nr:hypothetical protein DNTS_016119 [Danionella translucida]